MLSSILGTSIKVKLSKDKAMEKSTEQSLYTHTIGGFILKLKLSAILKSILFLVVFLLLPSSLFASDCFSASPGTDAGRGEFEEIIPRELEDGEYEALEELLQGLDGRWQGTAEVLVCKGTIEDPLEETDKYSISSVVKMSRGGQFALKSTLTSREKKTKQHESIHLHLSKNLLATQDNRSVSDLELISVSSDQLVYLRKSVRKKVIGHGRKAAERVMAIQKTGNTSFVVEEQVYLQGGLYSVSTWNLEKN